MTEQANNWSDYWRQEGAGGEVFVDPSGKKHPELETYWQDLLQQLPPQQHILDIACGGGSIFQALPSNHASCVGHTHYGLDLSTEALKLLNSRYPEAFAINAQADAIPFLKASLDMAVSQFGIEYAADKAMAFQRAIACLKPGGRLECLCHYQDGQIDRRVAPQYLGTQAVIQTNFIGNAIMLIETKLGKHEGAYVAARAAFIDGERKLVAAMHKAREGVHVHLYAGFRKMFANIEKYNLRGIITWLEQMRTEIKRADARFAQMTYAALSTTFITTLVEQLQRQSCQQVIHEPFMTPNSAHPIAWRISVIR